jgi:hypothetical protein
VRPQFLRALLQPLEDIETAAKKVERFRKPVLVLRSVEAKADLAERALETLSLGLALTELYIRAGEDEEPKR